MLESNRDEKTISPILSVLPFGVIPVSGGTICLEDALSINRGLFTSASEHWTIPITLYNELCKEFQFNDDPCPINPTSDGLSRPWGSVSFCNPPYGRKITDWLAKGWLESLMGKTVVFLIPSRTDTQWWHDYVMQADEIRFLRGRLKFGDAKNSAPFPSAIVVFRGSK